ncbi:MAG TPA: dephospho-CoA kinase [Bryobacteraceae bacterium]
MLKAGLTGGYASGKSFVAAELERLGCHLLYADQLGHAVLQPGGAAYQPTIDLFGSEILAPGGAIDRQALASIVFASGELLASLNAIVHPAVFELEEKMLQEFETQDPRGVAVLEAAILIETGRYRACDKLILTACSLETQVMRGLKRDRLTREQVLARIEKQMPLEQKKAFADYVVDTDGPKEDTLIQVRRIFVELQTLARESPHA